MTPTRAALAAMFAATCAPAAGAYDLPKEVTPAVRAACEADVRRLCIREGSTVASVKSCVIRSFGSLNTTCKLRLVAAGLVSSR